MLNAIRRWGRAALVCSALAGTVIGTPAAARVLPASADLPPLAAAVPPGASTTQNDCKSLSQAVEQVRRRGDVERVISAETRVSNGREVHYIRVMTRDGKVRTERVNGCRRS